ncbi:hypothetical protein BGZ72_004418 [Mortierella alpina]|nr:hypothetical protein BGZ72_004418 [Mortierella alpina]
MSLQVNFTTHAHDLRAAYESILRPLDPKNGDNWALFGYDKGTNDLKVLGQGNGGLEELQEEFMDGKVQYAFVRIVDPNSKLNKFVLVAWCGDGVPESKKGLFNSHLADVSLFLKGYHLQINARCEADVTPAQIMKRLNEASGSKYSVHNETQQPERITPLQSAYKKTEIPDIAALQRNPTKPEPAPKYNLGGTKPLSSSTTAFTSPSSPSKLEGRVWPPPSSSSSNSGAASPPSSKPAVAERSWKTSGGGSSYTASTGSGFNKVAPPASLLSYGNSSPEPVVNKAHQMRLEREAREKEERERIKREIEASEARERQAAGGGSQSTAQKLAEERRLQEEKERARERERGEQEQQSQSQGSNRVREERLAREKEERERAEAEDAARSAREMFKAREQSSAREQATQREDDLKRQQEQQQQQKREREAREAREAEERRQQEQEEQQHQQRQEEEARRMQEDNDARRREDDEREEEEQRRLIQQEQERQEEEQQRQLHLREQEERQRQEAEAEEHERRLQEEVSAATAQSVALGADALLASTEHPELTTAGSVSAIVLYSYDKSEENEMTLFEGEIIRNVTELDVGWWSGESEDGTRSGLFPANYVEVIEHAHEHAGLNGEGAATGEADYQHQDDHGHGDYQDEQAHAHAAVDHVEAHAVAPEAGHAKKPSAVALYDYQAGEPNEISFAEGEAIVEIEFVTDDWWSGTTEGGAVGLFPANYVEMIA